MIGGATAGTKSKFAARQAKPEDLNVFLEMARLSAEENKTTFDEDDARYTFAGIARADPAIHLLEAEREVVGFAIVRSIRLPFTRALGVQQDAVFVRADRRCKAAEIALHEMTLAVLDAMDHHTDASLLVGASEHALEVIEYLRGRGLRDSALRMTGTARPLVTHLADETRH